MSKKYGLLIAQKRKECGMTQKELAEKIGKTPQAISAWEVGRNEPNMDDANQLANVFGCSVADIMGWDKSYYIKSETEIVAEEIFHNPELRALFSAARDAEPDDLRMVHDMLLALKRKTQK